MTITPTKVKTLIEKKGVDITVTVDSVSHDASTNTTTVSTTTYTPKGVVYDVESYLVDGDTIRAGDKRCLLAAKDIEFAPTEAMSVEEGGEKYRVLLVKEFKDEGQSLMYQLNLRKGAGVKGSRGVR